MHYRTKTGKELSLTRNGVNVTLPLIRKDSEVHILTRGLWAIYTPSTGTSGALLIGPEESCKEAVKEVMDGTR